jgi:hypothetical protein
MQPNPLFTSQTKAFWADVRLISQEVGYTDRKTKLIRVPTPDEVRKSYEKLSLSCDHLFDAKNNFTPTGKTTFEYFQYRADVLSKEVKSNLMDADDAEKMFDRLKAKLNPTCPMPMNKQKGEKKKNAFLTCMINMLIEANSKGHPCDYDPRVLTTITNDKHPVRTMSRRVDGAFPAAINPIAIWEIKEYYYTTTFGSRVADGVYETLLDGMEIEEVQESEGIDVKHYLFVDSHYTWWECGRSYLCRLMDMMHMGYCDEVIFGKEVESRLPILVAEWVASLE